MKLGILLYNIIRSDDKLSSKISSHLLLPRSAIRHGALTINMVLEERKFRIIQLSRTSWLKRSLNMLCQDLPSRSRLRRNRILQHLENDSVESRLAHYAGQKYEFSESYFTGSHTKYQASSGVTLLSEDKSNYLRLTTMLAIMLHNGGEVDFWAK